MKRLALKLHPPGLHLPLLKTSPLSISPRRYLYPQDHRRHYLNRFIHLTSCLALLKITSGSTRRQEKML